MKGSEKSLDQSQGVENPSRRWFLTEVPTIGAGLMLGKWVSREEKISYEGLKVPGATFYPVYERHDEGPYPSQFEGKPSFDAFSIEFYGHYNTPPRFLIPEILFGTARYLRGNISDPNERERSLVMFLDRWGRLLYKLALDETYLVFPDVQVPKPENDLATAFMDNIAVIEAGLSAASATLAHKIGNTTESVSNSKRIFSRREFITGLGKASALYLASPLVGSILVAAGVSGYKDEEKRVSLALRRLAMRLNGIQSNFHPEDTVIFVRNLMWAMKLLELKDWFGEASSGLVQHNTNVGFLAGAAHSGVEDFLVLGPDFCANVLELLPRPYLRALVKCNGGVENAAKVRIISPLKPQDIDNVNLLLDEIYKFGMYGVMDYDNFLALNLTDFLSPPAIRIERILKEAES